jgi:Protein of unknown function (DUF3558)
MRKWAPAILLAAALLAGCGDGGRAEPDGDGEDRDSAQGDTTTPDDAGATSAACDLLTTDEVSDLFGHPAEVAPGEGGSDAVAANCLWEAEVGDEESPTLYQLQLSVFTGGERLDPGQWGGTPEPLDGPGEDAFLVRGGDLGTTAGYRDGDTSVLLHYGILLGEDAPDPAAQADEVAGLLDAIERRLAPAG